MEFTVNVDGIDYNVKTSQGQELHYLVEHSGRKYELVLSDDAEWVGLNIPSGTEPIPVDAIGAAIKSRF
ncbi:hypothetical protein [Desertivirga xinjiangensis]|uniref:hypothetical protein n=1 Tax=Desertivirga xinjiangensis TaxID=539206 RepID=UPI00210A1591|nr:hypothetical protein [Pedobacter xinjiangensis]